MGALHGLSLIHIFVEQQLASGRIQCAAMSRQLLADPDWVNKLKNGQAEQIHRCLRCNKKIYKKWD